MKISNRNVDPVHRLYENQQRHRQNAADAAGRTADKVELSAESRTIEAARRSIEAAPEVRHDKVESLKGALARGQYEVDARAVARKMIADMLRGTGDS